jgi:hypothetical protein
MTGSLTHLHFHALTAFYFILKILILKHGIEREEAHINNKERRIRFVSHASALRVQPKTASSIYYSTHRVIVFIQGYKL